MTHTCAKCGYSADVSGGPDRGFVVEVETCSCDGCRELVDVVTGGFDTRGESTPVPTSARRCPECGSSRVRPWPDHRPCPKCGGEMNAGGGTVTMWD